MYTPGTLRADQPSYLVLVLKDFPEIFWCDGKVSGYRLLPESEAHTVLEPQYLYKAEEQKEAKAKGDPGSGGRPVPFWSLRRRQAIMRRFSTCTRYIVNTGGV